jgi:hypothetical protein
MLTFAGHDPFAFGMNVTEMLQLAPGASWTGHVFVCEYWFGHSPPSATLLILSGTVPALLTVTVCGLL